MKIPAHIKIASWFLAFEGIFWFFGNDFLEWLRKGILYNNWVFLQNTLPQKIWIILSLPALLFSLFCLSMFVKTWMQRLEKAVSIKNK